MDRRVSTMYTSVHCPRINPQISQISQILFGTVIGYSANYLTAPGRAAGVSPRLSAQKHPDMARGVNQPGFVGGRTCPSRVTDINLLTQPRPSGSGKTAGSRPDMCINMDIISAIRTHAAAAPACRAALLCRGRGAGRTVREREGSGWQTRY